MARPYEVVLATWNGAAFLDQQLASIEAQSVRPQRILVADDASSDATPALLERWRMRSLVPLEVLPALTSRQGSCASFERLLAASRAAYVMPADQDDIWEPDKAARLLRAMAALELRWGTAQPLLVHSDLSLIDADGHRLGSSFHRFQGLRPGRDRWLAIALQNVVSGCACLVNRACVEQALPFPAEVVLHDWWLALVAAHRGAIGYVPQACVRYRLHGGNEVGALGWRRQLRRRLHQGLAADGPERLVGPGLRQLRACVERFGPGDDPRQSQALADLFHPSPLHRSRGALALRLRKHGLWRTLGFYGALWRWQPQRAATA